MIRIRTRSIPATDTEPKRVRATTSGGSTLTVPYDHTSPAPHADVAEQLVGRPVTMVEETADGYRFVAGRSAPAE